MLEEPGQVLDVEGLARSGRQRAGQERFERRALAPQRSRAGEGGAVEGERCARVEVVGVERLERVAAREVVAGAGVGAEVEARVEGVEQLADRHRRRPVDAGALVGAGVDDDEVVGGGDDRVEQQLAVLGGGVALADAGVAGEDVVAVRARLAGEDLVVHAEQAHDAVRHRAHRHQRRDGERAGAEVGARRTPGEAVGENGADVVQRHVRVVRGALEHGGELAARLRELPGVGRDRRGEPVEAEAQRVDPGGEGLLAAQALDHRAHPVGQLAEAPDPLDVAGVDLVQGQRVAQPVAAVRGHRHADQQPVEALRPGVVPEAVERERLAVGGVEAPADPGALGELAQAGQVLVVEAEAAPHRVGLGEVEQLGRRDARVGEVEQRRERAEERVDLAQRAVGEPDPQPVARVCGLLAVARPEARGDERRERLDVGAQHDHVPRLERRVGAQQAEDRLAQHLDLAVRPVAPVDADAAVVGGRLPRGRAVVAQVVLEAGEECGRRVRGLVVVVGVPAPRESQLELADVAAQAGEQGVRDPLGARVVGAPLGVPALEMGPQRGRGVRQPEVDVVVGGERVEHAQLGVREPGGAEEGEPSREAPRGRDLRDGLGGARCVEAGAQPAPQLGLPAQVLGRARVVARRPRPDQGGPVVGIAAEQTREVAGRGEPSTAPRARGVADDPEERAQRRAPGLLGAVVDGLEQRPHEALGPPGVVVGDGEHPGHHLGGRGEDDVGAHPVVATGDPQPVGQTLGEPALDPACGHGDELGLEGVVQRVGEHVGQGFDEPVGPLGPVHVEHARTSPSPGVVDASPTLDEESDSAGRRGPVSLCRPRPLSSVGPRGRGRGAR